MASENNNVFLEICMLLALSTVIYLKALWNGHTMDDHPAVEWNVVVTGRKAPFLDALFSTDFWGQDLNSPHSHGSFRPLVTAMYRLQALMTAQQTGGIPNETSPHPGLIHVINIVLHALSTVMLYWFLNSFVANRVFCHLDFPGLNLLASTSSNESEEESKGSSSFCISLSFVTALLFAIHPIHAEAVCGGVGQAEMMCSFLILAGIFWYCKLIALCNTEQETDLAMKPTFLNQISTTLMRQIFPSLIILLLAILSAASKEQGFMLLPLCILIEFTLVGSKKFSPWRVFVTMTATLALAAIRLKLFGPPRTQLFLWFDNSAAFQPFPIRHLTYTYLPFFCMWLMAYPFNLCADWGDGATELVKSFGDPRLLPVSLCIGCIVAKTGLAVRPLLVTALQFYRNKFFPPKNATDYLEEISPKISCTADDIYLKAFIIYAVTFLPSSNLLGPVGFVVAERVLYAPSAGFFLIVAIGFHRLLTCNMLANKAGRRILTAIFLITCLSLATKTILRTFDWESDLSLSMSGLRTTDSNARIFINVGAYVRETQSDCHKALAYFDKAVRLNPKMAKAHFNRARCMRTLLEERLAFAKANPGSEKQTKSNNKKKSKSKAGEPSLEQLARACDISLRHCIVVADYNIPPNGFVPNHVAECYLDLANLMTVHGELYLGSLAQTQQTADRALELCDLAQKMRPDFARAFISKANIFMAMARFEDAKGELKQARRREQNNIEVIRALAWILAEKDKKDEAALKLYFEIMKINPNYEMGAIELAKVVIRGKRSEHYTAAAFWLSQFGTIKNERSAEIASLFQRLSRLMRT